MKDRIVSNELIGLNGAFNQRAANLSAVHPVTRIAEASLSPVPFCNYVSGSTINWSPREKS